MNLAQITSSDPSSSVWVAASAGTGKTKVLTDRVVRLLISGAESHKILCLTFTNAAASEMLGRINKELKIFATTPLEDLKVKLYGLLGRAASATEVSVAKNLFQELLTSSNQLQIQTIHAFCQGIRSRYITRLSSHR